jgi:hypothetical protein
MIDKLQYRKQANNKRQITKQKKNKQTIIDKLQYKKKTRQTMIDKLQYRKQTNNDRQITIQKTKD